MTEPISMDAGSSTVNNDVTDGTDRDQVAAGNSSVNFLRNNFQLFGFGGSKQALFQTIKELIDNSIDAIRKCVSSPGNIRIEIEKDFVRVTDNGIGFTDPQMLLSVFRSTAIDSGVLTAGRYGIGLSALFLYSYSVCNKPIRIITKTNEDETCYIGDYVVDAESGNPFIVQSIATNAPLTLTSGSSITIPINWNAQDGPLVEELLLINMLLTVYITRLQLLPQSVSLIHLVINVNELQVDRLFETDYTETIQQKFEDCSKYGYPSGATLCVEEITDESLHDVCVQVTAILIESREEDDDDDNGVDVSEEHYMNVKLIRYVNGIPLLDCSDTNEYKECGITKALISELNWKEYGKKVTELNPVVTHFSKIHFKLSTIYDPYQYNSSTSNCDRALEFIFLVNVSSRSSLYTSLRKAAIVNQPRLTRCIADAGRIVMDAIKHRYSTAFMNAKEWRVSQLKTRYIPSLSRSIARSINLMHSNPSNPESLENRQLSSTLNALEINPNDPATSVASVISSLLLGIISSEPIDDDIAADQEEALDNEVHENENDEQDWS